MAYNILYQGLFSHPVQSRPIKHRFGMTLAEQKNQVFMETKK